MHNCVTVQPVIWANQILIMNFWSHLLFLGKPVLAYIIEFLCEGYLMIFTLPVLSGKQSCARPPAALLRIAEINQRALLDPCRK